MGKVKMDYYDRKEIKEDYEHYIMHYDYTPEQAKLEVCNLYELGLEELNQILKGGK